MNVERMNPLIEWVDFQRVEIRVGTIVQAEVFREAQKAAYKLWVDLGEELGVKKSSAQVTVLYDPEDLIGRQVICVCNFPEKQIGPFRSQILVTGFPGDSGKVVLAIPERPVKNGTRLA